MHERAFPELLGQRVRARREDLGLSQIELAELAGCSTRFVHTVEAGKPTLRLDAVLRVLQALGLRLEIQGPGAGAPREPAGRKR
jgi:HTH-type transcriptional regulator / antitoxin HipB